MPLTQPGRRDEHGETLIELLMTIAIIGIAAAALLGALITSVSSSGEHRTLTQEEAGLKSYADLAKQAIELSTGPAAPPAYTPCANPAAYSSIVTQTPPPGIVITISGITYWNGHSFGSSCDQETPADLQQITLLATAQHGASQTLSFVVRNPNYAPPSGD